MRAFVDTNVLVYLFDADAPDKQQQARELFRSRRDDDRTALILSTQVLQEFYVAVTRKLARPLAPETAARAVADLSRLPVVQIDTDTVLEAIDASRRRQLSLWDALILRAAVKGGATTIHTEDLQTGAVLEGVRIDNPFA